MTVKAARVDAAKVPNTWQSGGGQAVHEFPHDLATEGYVTTDGLTFAQFKVRDRLARFVDHRLASSDGGHILDRVIERGFLKGGVHAHAHNDFVQTRNLVHIGVASLGLQSRLHLILILLV